jgi:hypothetical protein
MAGMKVFCAAAALTVLVAACSNGPAAASPTPGSAGQATRVLGLPVPLQGGDNGLPKTLDAPKAAKA